MPKIWLDPTYFPIGPAIGMPHWPGPQELQGLEFRTLPSFCHACPSPALFSFFFFFPQDAPFCPSDGHSCATSICWTTLWRNGVWQRQGRGKAMESWRGGGAGEMCLCLFVCVLWGHHASVIFRAQLKLMSYFCVCSGVSSPVQKF